METTTDGPTSAPEPSTPSLHHALSPAILRVPLVALLLALVALLPACDGTNIFTGEIVEFEPEEQDDEGEGEETIVNGGGFFDFVRQGTLLDSDDERLRFRWADGAELRLQLGDGVTARERAAFRRGVEEVARAGGPEIRIVTSRPNIVVEALAADDYRELDETRPWSFSRTWVTADRERGITEVDIALQLELDAETLDRAVLHALGHAVGIMGHPAVPGDRHVMAARVPEGTSPPTRFTDLEEQAIRFLYSQGIVPGMTHLELAERAETWTP